MCAEVTFKMLSSIKGTSFAYLYYKIQVKTTLHMLLIVMISFTTITVPTTNAQGQRFDLAALSNLRAAVNQPNSNRNLNSLGSFTCPDKDVHFELVTGYVFTAPDDMLDSRPGTLMLTDCIELCRRNSTCKSANFETGLCVLFGSSADDFPGKQVHIYIVLDTSGELSFS